MTSNGDMVCNQNEQSFFFIFSALAPNRVKIHTKHNLMHCLLSCYPVVSCSWTDAMHERH